MERLNDEERKVSGHLKWLKRLARGRELIARFVNLACITRRRSVCERSSPRLRCRENWRRRRQWPRELRLFRAADRRPKAARRLSRWRLLFTRRDAASRESTARGREREACARMRVPPLRGHEWTDLNQLILDYTVTCDRFRFSASMHRYSSALVTTARASSVLCSPRGSVCFPSAPSRWHTFIHLSLFYTFRQILSFQNQSSILFSHSLIHYSRSMYYSKLYN